MTLRVLSVVSELFPLVKTGGLADVAAALPAALAPEDIAVRTLLPGYPAVMAAVTQPELVHEVWDLFGGPARVLACHAVGLDLLVLDAPHLYARPGGPYRAGVGGEWPDNAFRFAALGLIAAQIGHGAVAAFVPDIVHAHDWQTGLAPAYLHYAGGPRPGTVITVHNLAFQGQFPLDLLPALGLPPAARAIEGVEYYNSLGFLKAGLWSADRITTVSPTYAVEIMTDEGGMGLGGLLRSRAPVVSGILNGIDTSVWDPARDPHLPANYDAATAATARARNKAAVQARFGLAADPDALLFGVVSRLEWQKGMDLLLGVLPALTAQHAQLAVVGSGDPGLETGFAAAVGDYPGRVGCMFVYDEALAHLVQGGCDALLVPSHFEPCGLTQLCALRYGSLPVVARVGGLSDTVIDANEMAVASGVATGVQFYPVTPERLAAAITRTALLWRDRELWRRLQQNGMATDVSWRRPARHYAALFRALVEARGG
jgi:starch synthase